MSSVGIAMKPLLAMTQPVGRELHVIRAVPRKGEVVDLVRLESELRQQVRPGDAVVQAGGEVLVVVPELEAGARAARRRLGVAARSSHPVSLRIAHRRSKQAHVRSTLDAVDSGRIAVARRRHDQPAAPAHATDPRYEQLLARAGGLYERTQELEVENRALRLQIGLARALSAAPEQSERRRFRRRRT